MAEQTANLTDSEGVSLDPVEVPDNSARSRSVHPGWRQDAEHADNNPCALLLPVTGLRKRAIGILRRNTKCIVLKELPQTREDVARCLEPALSKYARTLFDGSARQKLRVSVPTGDSATAFRVWLRSECLPAVLDDTCSTVHGQFLIAVSRIAEAIPESHGKFDAARRALAGILTGYFFGSDLISDLKHSLALDLEDQSLRWESTAEKRANPAATVTEAASNKPPAMPTGMDQGEYLQFIKAWFTATQFEPTRRYVIEDFRIEQREKRMTELERRSRSAREEQPNTTSPKPTALANAETRKRRYAVLKRYREGHGLNSMGDLARRFALSVTAVQGMVRGDRKRYSEARLSGFLKDIGVSPSSW